MLGMGTGAALGQGSRNEDAGLSAVERPADAYDEFEDQEEEEEVPGTPAR